MTRDSGWMAHAACRDKDPRLFFPENGEYVKVAEARAICRQCPVRQQCLDYALTFSAAWLAGVWGGLTEQERRKLPRTGTQPKSQVPFFAGVPVDRSNHDLTEWRDWGPSSGWRPSGPPRRPAA